MVARLPKDEFGNPIQVLALGDKHSVAFGAAAASSAAVGAGTQVIRVCSDEDCFIDIGAAPAATTASMLLPAMTPEYIQVTPGVDVISVIRRTTDGQLSIVEMT